MGPKLESDFGLCCTFNYLVNWSWTNLVTAKTNLPWFVLTISVLALAVALIGQYAFGLEPCELCLLQRVPFVVTGLLAVVALLVRNWRLGRALMRAAACAFLFNAGLAFYHVGVEQAWWASACSGGAGAIDVQDLMAALSKPATVSCSEPAWSFYGITMAAMNVVFCLGLSLITFANLRRR